jgi:sugar phosphate isomerase/epimerase
MRLPALGGAHLSYCTNIHPGESFTEVDTILRSFVPEVKRKVAPREPFGVGLRLAARASAELERPGSLERMREALAASQLYVFTLNGFPYGEFHGTRVKERVYRPDWLEEARVGYTNSLARVLALLLPEGVNGSISTVPGCFAARNVSGSARGIALNLARAAGELVQIERDQGKSIALALEPEPACFLETTDEAVRFFQQELWHHEVITFFARLTGLDAKGAERALRRHVGVCLDTCHAAVEFESPRAALGRYLGAGIQVPKIQISAGLSLTPSAENLVALRAFEDTVYLHQTVTRSPAGELTRYVDLADAFASPAAALAAEWRVHFHVPVFETNLGAFSSTQAELLDLLIEAPELSPHLEVETYTFDVLPAEYRAASVTEDVARELRFTLDALARRAP